MLDRYLSGECSREEETALARELDANPDAAQALAQVQMLRRAAQEAARFDVSVAWRHVAARIEGGAPSRGAMRQPFGSRVRQGQRRWRRAHYGIAATVLLTVGAAIAVRQRTSAQRPTPVAVTSPSRAYHSAVGQRTELLLTDGTRVELNVSSSLQVPAGYGVTTRDVYLDGEAYFDVRHDPAHPFRVHAGSVVAEDVGTSFVIRAYRGDSAAVAAVASGELAVHAAHADASAVPVFSGQVAHLNAAGDIAVYQHADLGRYFAWRQGRLDFHETPMPAVARELERWYGVEVAIADTALANAGITASFDNEPVSEVLRTIAQSLGARFIRQGMHVRFFLPENPQ
ncbi:MAG: FecR family protein [Gemmatimonadaceae bacterium]